MIYTSNLTISYFHVVISSAGMLFAIAAAIVAKKWELIKFCLFLKFGIKFKDKADMIQNIDNLDYDAFMNYK